MVFLFAVCFVVVFVWSGAGASEKIFS